eukprot:CAMPEP_0194036188 /NCGR_PEP_ID=MMETSP0009_2-20130614/8552_1 /TAXON_ID=210454 /ORGANISM="Grammatophora oceanica, Strain CCMP 410" /LENGTH=130 /DNA_ID=CAMNT_0038677821 /DNA_START=39 /DNA_END=427 /DNA_ORIENTATION=+
MRFDVHDQPARLQMSLKMIVWEFLCCDLYFCWRVACQRGGEENPTLCDSPSSPPSSNNVLQHAHPLMVSGSFCWQWRFCAHFSLSPERSNRVKQPQPAGISVPPLSPLSNNTNDDDDDDDDEVALLFQET